MTVLIDTNQLPPIPADGAITAAKIATNAVNAAKIANNAVTTVKIAANAVTTAKIDDGAVDTAKLADVSVTTAKLADSAVETAKVADSAITNAKVSATAEIASTKIAFGVCAPTANSATAVRLTAANGTTNVLVVNTTNNRVNVGSATSTAALNLPAGVAGAASLKITPGVAPTTPNDGDMWVTTDGLFVRIAGVTRQVTVT